MCENSVVNGTDEKDKIQKLLQSFLLAPFAPSGPEGPPRTSTFSSRQSKRSFSTNRYNMLQYRKIWEKNDRNEESGLTSIQNRSAFAPFVTLQLQGIFFHGCLEQQVVSPLASNFLRVLAVLGKRSLQAVEEE